MTQYNKRQEAPMEQDRPIWTGNFLSSIRYGHPLLLHNTQRHVTTQRNHATQGPNACTQRNATQCTDATRRLNPTPKHHHTYTPHQPLHPNISSYSSSTCRWFVVFCFAWSTSLDSSRDLLSCTHLVLLF